MLGYGVLEPCACDWVATHSTIASARVPNAFIGTIFRFIASFEVVDMMSSPSYETSPRTAFTCRGPAPLSTRGPLPEAEFRRPLRLAELGPTLLIVVYEQHVSHLILYRCIERRPPQSTVQPKNFRLGGCLRMSPNNSNYSRTYAKQVRGMPPVGSGFYFSVASTGSTVRKRPRSFEEQRSLFQTVREECRARQLLMSVLVSSLASMGSRKGLLASGALAMASFISLEAAV